MTSEVTPGYDGWRVSVLDQDGAVCGAGVLVTADLALTCAHVVTKALRTSPSDSAPAAPVVIGFPTASAIGHRAATVADGGWVAAAPDHTGDLCLLRLDRPVDLAGAVLSACGPPSAREIQVFGHPAGDALGRWAVAQITGTAGPTGEWVQLSDRSVAGHRIERGFSGAGVIERETGLVIGIIVGTDQAASAKGAWMMSMEAVATRIPALRGHLRPRRAGEPGAPGEPAAVRSGTQTRRVSADERARLVVLVADLPDQEVLAAARVALGPLGLRADVDPRDRPAVIDVLADQIGRPGAPPLLVFLTHLADRQPEPERVAALRAWRERLRTRWQLPVDAIAAAAGEAARAVPRQSYLVVELREDAPTPGAYQLTVLLRHDDGTGRVLAMYDDQLLGLQEIPGHVGERLRQVLHGIEPLGELIIEFVLPAELLSHPVDQFQVALDDGLHWLGATYPVVVRSADRMRRPLFHRRWQARSSWLRANGGDHHRQAITWVPLPAGITPSLENRLRERAGYSEENPVCLVFTWRGQTALNRAVPRALGEALELGMPALLWCRHPRVVDHFAAEMANQLSGLPVADLVQRVHQLRRSADGHDEHVGSHVCLLWDDPARLMPDQGLSAPA